MLALPLPDPALTDGVVTLRQWAPGDAAFVVAACRDPQMARFMPELPSPYTEADAREWFARHEPTRLAGHGIVFAVSLAATGEPLGTIAVNEIDRALNSGVIGYWLAAAARGSGYMTRAVRLLARWSFDELGLARLELTTDPENAASQAVAERSGFRREGYLRSHMVMRSTGERRDSCLFGLLPGDLAVADDRP